MNRKDGEKPIRLVNQGEIRKKKFQNKKGAKGLKESLNSSVEDELDDEDDEDKKKEAGQEHRQEKPLEEATKAKIVHAIANAVHNQVKGLNRETLASYLGLLRASWPVDPADWDQFEAEAWRLVDRGPTFKVGSVIIKTENNHLNMKQLRVNIYFEDTPSLTLKTDFQENDINVVFNEPGSLPTPGLEDPLLRIDVIKKSKKSGEKLIGTAAKKLSELICNQPVYIVLEEKNLGVLSSSIQATSSGRSNLLVTGCLNKTDVHANQSIPQLYTQMLLRTATQVFDIPESLISYEVLDNYMVSVTRTSGAQTQGSWTYVRQGCGTTRLEVSESTPTLHCLLTDKIKMHTRDRSPSPNPATMSTRPSRLSLGSLMTGGSNNKPEVFKTFALTNLSHLSPVQMDFEANRWTAQLKPYQSKSLELPEFGEVYLRVLMEEMKRRRMEMEVLGKGEESVNGENNKDWDGTVSASARTILHILETYTKKEWNEDEDKQIKETIAMAYIKAHNTISTTTTHALNNNFLRPHVEALGKSKRETGDDYESFTILDNDEIDQFVHSCLRVIKNMRSHTKEDVIAVVEHLTCLLDEQTLQAKVKDALCGQVQAIFKIWLQEAAVDEKKSKKSSVDEKKLFPDTRRLSPGQAEEGDKVTLQALMRMKEIIVRCKGMETLTHLLNNYVYPDIYNEGMLYMSVFGELDVNFREVVGLEYIRLTIQQLKSYLWSRSEIAAFLRSDLEFDEDNLEIEYFQQAYNCYSALQRVYSLVSPGSNESAHTFQDFSGAWLNLGIKKAKVQLRRLISHAKHDEVHDERARVHHYSPQDLDNKTRLIKQVSEEDHISHQLTVFLAISDSCWKLWEDLTYSTPEKELEGCIQLIDGLNALEKCFIEEKKNLYLDDQVLETKEMAKFVRLLDGLKERYSQVGDKLNRLIDNKTYSREYLAQTFPKLEKMKQVLEEEIEEKMSIYARGHRAKFKASIEDKEVNRLTSEDSVLRFIDNEMCRIHEYFHRSKRESQLEREKFYSRQACLVLWNEFEAQLLEFFSKKKRRNLEKNKPSRFNMLSEGLGEVIECKKIAMEANIVQETSIEALKLMHAELQLLTAPSHELVNQFLRDKEHDEDHVVDQVDGKDDCPVLNYHLGYLRGDDKILLEIRSIMNLRRQNKDKISPEFRATFFPPSSGDVLIVNQRKSYPPINQTSWLFDTSEDGQPVDRLLFELPLHNFTRRTEDCFICVDLVDYHPIKPSFIIGDAVFKVCKNGTVLPDIPEFSSLEEFLVPSFSLKKILKKEGNKIYQSKQFLELRDRRDGLAKSFIKWQRPDKNEDAVN